MRLARRRAHRCVVIACILNASQLWAAEIEEIVVTAEKRESMLQETPVAVTAVTRENIQTQGLDDFGKVQFVAPALVYAEIADMAQITMRGVGVDISTMDAEPGVAVHSDGVYRGGLVSSSSLMFDLERIEVLRGPQGTLYGRNSTGGSLNVVTRLPDDELAVEAAVLYGEYDRRRIEVGADLPVVPEAFNLRVAGAYDERDGYADNDFTGAEEDDSRARFLKLAGVFDVSDTVEFVLRTGWSRSEIGGPPFVKTDDHPVPPFLLSSSNPGGVLNIPGIPLFTLVCGAQTCADALNLDLSPPGVGSDDPRNLFSDGTTQFDRKSVGVNGTLTWDVADDVQLKSITSYFDIEQTGDQTNNDGVDISYLTDNFRQENQEWSQEFTLTGRSGELDWIVGAFYYESDIDEKFEFTLPALQASFEALFGILSSFDVSGLPNGAPLPSGSLAFFGTRLDGSAAPFPFLDFQVLQDLSSVAAYGQGTYHFTETLRGTVGVRWTKDKKDDEQTVVNNLGGDFCRDIELSDDWDEMTGKLGVDMDVGDDTLLYGSLSRGYKAGGFNGGLCSNPYDPEIIIAYEVGTKSRLLNNSVQLNTSAFYYDYSDLQARLFINNASIVQNAADARSWGVELEGLWLVNEVLRFEGSVSYLKAEFEDFQSTDPLNPQIGASCNPLTGLDCLQDLSGNDVLRAPEWKTTLAAEYDLHLAGAGTVTLRGEYSYTDEMYHTIFNNDFALQDSISLVNARVIWTPPGDNGLDVHVFVENLSDEEYIVIHAPNATTGGTISHFGPPRVWGLQVRWSGVGG